MLPANHSFDTNGLDDPAKHWLQKRVRVTTHPEWGVAHVVRWYPATDHEPERLRIFGSQMTSPQVVPLADTQIVADELPG